MEMRPPHAALTDHRFIQLRLGLRNKSALPAPTYNWQQTVSYIVNMSDVITAAMKGDIELVKELVLADAGCVHMAGG